MKKVEVVLISGRTADQGASLEVGKTSKEYFESAAAVELSAADADELGLRDGDAVEVATAHGSVVVKCRRSKGLDAGMAFFPYGPWANRVFGSQTGGTGMPSFKGVRATVGPAGGREVPTLVELMEALRGSR
ncbi:MAG: molybdopterin dinucleotide binding domain-containing protein [Candidatus Bathyarchaeia archaeon]